jgi:hypothetical protein
LIRLFPLAAWAILAVAVVMLVVGLAGADGKSDGIWFELAKAGLGVFAVAFLGGAAAASFDARKLDREYRADFVSELWDAYHEIKSVRRALKAAGVSDAGAPADSEPGKALREQMPRLDAAQLTLEKLFGTVDHEPGVFSPYDQRLRFLLRIAERYANNVYSDWEDVKKRENKFLSPFVGKARGPGGIKYLSEAVHRAADLVYALRSGQKTRYPTDARVDCDLLSDKPFREHGHDFREPDCDRMPVADQPPATIQSRSV